MGGRGTFAIGNIVAYRYETVEKIEGVKVLQKIDKKASASLPEESHSSNSYIVLDKVNGVFRQYREYNSDHLITFEIGYHFESGLSENGKNVFHIHDFSKPGIENRQKARLMKPEEISKYKKYFKNVSEKEIEDYLEYYRRFIK